MNGFGGCCCGMGRAWGGYYLTAYGIAVKHGFVGTEAEWLESLTPKRGTDYWTEADRAEMVNDTVNAVLEALPAAEEVSF